METGQFFHLKLPKNIISDWHCPMSLNILLLCLDFPVWLKGHTCLHPLSLFECSSLISLSEVCAASQGLKCALVCMSALRI